VKGCAEGPQTSTAWGATASLSEPAGRRRRHHRRRLPSRAVRARGARGGLRGGSADFYSTGATTSHPSLRAAAVVIDSHHVQSEHEVRVKAARRARRFYPLVHAKPRRERRALVRSGRRGASSRRARRRHPGPQARDSHAKVQQGMRRARDRTGRHRESQRRDKAAAPASASAGRSGDRAGLPARRATGVVQNA